MKKRNLRSALLLLLGIFFLFFTACGPGGSGESAPSGGGGGDDDGGGVVVTNPTLAGAIYDATGAKVTGAAAWIFSNPTEVTVSNGGFSTKDFAAGTHSIIVTAPGYADYGVSYQIVTLGASGTSVSMLLPTFDHAFTTGYASLGVNLTSNTVGGNFATLAIPAQTSQKFTLAGQATKESLLDFRLDYYDVTQPLPIPLPGPTTRAANLNPTLGVQAPSVVVSISPPLLRSFAPDATLVLPNPDGLTTQKVLYFDPESSKWVATGYTMAQASSVNGIPVDDGGLYGVFFETTTQPCTAQIDRAWKLNAQANDLVMVGGQIYKVGATNEKVTIGNIPVPAAGITLDVLVVDTSASTAAQTTVTFAAPNTTGNIVGIDGAIKKVSLSSSKDSLTVGGDTATLTVNVLDSSTTKLAGAAVTLSTTQGTLDNTTITTNTSGAATATLTSGTASSAADGVIVSAQSGGIDADNLTLTFNPKAPSQLTLVSAKPSVYANTGSNSPDNLDTDFDYASLLTLDVRDEYGNTVADNTSISLLVENAANQQQTQMIWNSGFVSSVSTTSGSAKALFVSKSNVGAFNVNAWYSAAVTDTVGVVVNPTPVGGVEVASNRSAMTASGADTATITATVIDINDRTIIDGTPVTFTTASGTFPGGLATVVATTTAGKATTTLTSSLNIQNVAITAQAGEQSDTTAVDFVPGPPAHIVFPQTTYNTFVGSGNQIAIAAEVYDNYGVGGIHNSVSNGTVIQFRALYPNGTITGIPLSAISAQTTNGVASVTFTPPTTPAGAYTVYAYYGAVDSDTPVTINVQQTTPADMTLTVASSPIVADGASHTEVTATVYDTYGNLVIDGTNVTFTTTAGALNQPASAGGTDTYVVATAGGVAKVNLYSSTSAATATVRATAGGVTKTNSVDFVSGATNVVTVSVTPTGIPGDGVSTATASALVKDQNGNPVEGETINFAATNGSFSPWSGQTDSDGRVSSIYTAARMIGGQIITATAGNGAFGTVTITLQEVQVKTVAVESSKPEITADGADSSQITATVTDKNGNAVADGTNIIFTTSAGTLNATAGGGGTTSYATTTTGGVATVALYGPTVVGTGIKVTASAGGASGFTTVDFVAGPPDSINVTVSPAGLLADGFSTSDVSALVQDQFGNPVPDETVNFTVASGSIIPVSAKTDENGVAEVQYTASSTAGAYAITATTGNGATGAANIQLQQVQVTSLVLEAGPNAGTTNDPKLVADGVDNMQIIATLEDTSGNPVADGTQVVFVNNTGYGTLGYIGNGSGGGNTVTVETFGGRATAILTSPTTSGRSAFITATSGTLVDSVTVGFIPGPPYRIVANANPASIPTNPYLCPDHTSRVYATVLDRTNNPVADGTEVVFSINKGWIWDDYPLCPEDDDPYPVVTSKSVSTANGVAKIGVLGSGLVEIGTVDICVDGLCYEDATGSRGVKISYGGTVGETSGLPSRIELSVTPAVIQVAGSGGTESATITAEVYDETGSPIQDYYEANDGSTVATQRTFESASAKFISQGFKAGDTVTINSGADSGAYTITAVNSETQVELETGGLPLQETHDGDLSFRAEIKNNIAFKILLGPNGGENMDGNENVGGISLKSTLNGVAYATLNSGAVPGAVTIQVTCTQGPAGSESVATATSAQIIIESGPPASISMLPDNSETNAGGEMTIRSIYTIMRDRYGNYVPDGTVAYFGLIDNVKKQGADVVIADSGSNSIATIGAPIPPAVGFISAGVKAGDTLMITEAGSALRGGYIIKSVDSETQVTLFKQVQADNSGLTYIVGDAQYGMITGSSATYNSGVHGVAYSEMLYPKYQAGNKVVYLYAMTSGFDQDGNPYDLGTTWNGYYSPNLSIGMVDLQAGNATLTANGIMSTTLTATVYDSTGTMMAPDGTEVAFTATNGTLSAATAQTVNGQATVTLTSPTAIGSADISACVSGTCGSVTVTFVAGPVDTLVLSISPNNLTADGVATSKVSVLAKDAFLNPVNNAVISFASTYGLFVAGSAATDSQGYAEATYRAPNAVPAGGKDPITVTSANGKTATGNITLIQVTVNSVAVTAGSVGITANGQDSTMITATVLDSNGSAVPDGTAVNFTASAGTMNYSTAVAPVANQKTVTAYTVSGMARALLFAATHTGKATVTATAGGVSGNVQVSFVPGAPAQVQVLATPSSLTADGASTSLIKATVLDAFNNPVEDGETVTFSVTDDGGSLSSLTQLTVGGIASVTYTAPASVPDGQVKVYASTTSGDQGEVTIQLSGPRIASVSLEIDPVSLPADGTSTAAVFATVTLVGGGPAPDGTSVTFEILSGGGSFAATTVKTAGGIAQAELTAGAVAGTAVIRAECGGRGAQLSVEYTPGSIAVSVVQNSLLGTGKETTEVLVTLTNADGQAITTAQTILFSLSDISMGTLNMSTANTVGPDFDEYNACVFTANPVGGSVDIIVKWNTNGVDVIGKATIDIQPPPAFLQLASGSPNPASINIKGTGGQSTSQLLFNVLDSVGNLVADGYIIDFAIQDGAGGAGGGEKVIPTTAKTSGGQVGTILQSGWASGAVNVKATYHHNQSVNIAASKVTITNGPPVGEGLNMSPRYYNISGSRNVGLADVISITANDVYNNRVPEGSAIFFATYDTGGILANGNAFTDATGTASDTLVSTADLPLQGFVSVTAEANNGGRTTRVNSIAMSPANPDTVMYVATNGGGVYKSTDAGATWNNMSKSSDYRGQNWIDPYVNDVTVDPDDATMVFAATGHGGSGALYRSFDGGLQWDSDNAEEVFGCLSINAEVTKVLCDDNGSDWIWIGTHGRGFVYSQDGGATPRISWSQPDISGSISPYSGTDGSTTALSAVFTSDSATFISSGFAPGDSLAITSGNDVGVYTVLSVDSETQLTLTLALGSSTSVADVTSSTAATIEGSSNIVVEGATFITSGYEVGDSVSIASGPDAGSYEIAAVVSETELTLNHTFGASVGKTVYGDDGVCYKGGFILESAESKFVTRGFKPGDLIAITEGPDIGLHTIDTVVDDATVILDGALTATYADPAAGTDGDTTAGSNVFSVPSVDLYSLGVAVGDTVAITTGADKGTYLVTAVTGINEVTLDSNLGATDTVGYLIYYADTVSMDAADGQTIINTKRFHSSSATFGSDGYDVGDVLVIRSGANAGAYSITQILGETDVLLDTADFAAGATSLDFSVYHGNSRLSFIAYHNNSGFSDDADNTQAYTATDVITVSNSRMVTSNNSSFISDGFAVGDTVTINAGPDAGVYTITSLTNTTLTLDRALTSNTCPTVYSVSDCAGQAGSDIIYTVAGNFLTAGVQAGDVLVITTAPGGNDDLGFFTVAAVLDAQRIQISSNLINTHTNGLAMTIFRTCSTTSLTVFHGGAEDVAVLANHDDTSVSYTLTSLAGSSADDAGKYLYEGRWVRDIVKVSGNGAAAVLYAGTQIGVFRSADGGQTWNFLKEDFEGDSILSLAAAKYGNHEVVYAGTEDGGIWIYDYDTVADTGAWTDYTTGLDRALLATQPEPNANNEGNGTFTDITVGADAKTEFWTMECTAAAAGGGTFSLMGSQSGLQPPVVLPGGYAPLDYTLSTHVSFTLKPGEDDFAVGDSFEFHTVRDNGKTVTDILLDVDNSLLYVTTSYYEGSSVFHQVGNLMVRNLDASGIPTGDWQDASVGLPQYDPPDDETLFSLHALALSRDKTTGLPKAIFAGGQGIHLYKATNGQVTTDGTTNVTTGEVYWQPSENYLSNVIMARNVILFSDEVAFAQHYSDGSLYFIGSSTTSSSASWAEIISDNPGSSTRTVRFTFYVEDANGNPPIVGTQLKALYYNYKEGKYELADEIVIRNYGDWVASSGTWRDPTDASTNLPFVITTSFDTVMRKVVFEIVPSTSCGSDPLEAPGCNGGGHLLTYIYSPG